MANRRQMACIAGQSGVMAVLLQFGADPFLENFYQEYVPKVCACVKLPRVY